MKNELKSHLQKQLDQVNTSLSFAEAKNIALIAFNVAMMGLLNEMYKDTKIILCITLSFIVTSSLVSILSFWPNLLSSLQKRNDKSNNENELNLIFFGDIAKIDNEKAFLEYTKKKYFTRDGSENTDHVIIDLASEVLINSKITKKKNNFFMIALILDIACLAVLMVVIMIA